MSTEDEVTGQCNARSTDVGSLLATSSCHKLTYAGKPSARTSFTKTIGKWVFTNSTLIDAETSRDFVATRLVTSHLPVA